MEGLNRYCTALVAFSVAFSSFALPNPQLVSKGKACLEHVDSCAIDKNLADINAVAHFLYQVGMNKNRGKEFSSGTFVIEDPGFKILNKLIDFVKLQYGDDICNEIIITTKSAYPRKSTHFNSFYLYNGLVKKDIFGSIIKPDCKYMHYGIDMGTEKLPALDKKHLLFGRIGTINGRDLIFVKMEEAGLSGFDAVKHALDLVTTTLQRAVPDIVKTVKSKLGLTKVTAELLEKEYNTLLDEASFDEGENPLVNFRRERMPGEILAYFLALLLESTEKQSDDFDRAKDLVKAEGIQAMVTTLEALLKSNTLKPDLKTKMADFSHKLREQYPKDYFMRFGNEIMVRPDDWKK
ncbi:MAG TPA: hypothetical protein VEL47_08040 [Myxococcota bacterium]|nr:hypothetical protein [Myxococcota bacterium]